MTLSSDHAQSLSWGGLGGTRENASHGQNCTASRQELASHELFVGVSWRVTYREAALLFDLPAGSGGGPHPPVIHPVAGPHMPPLDDDVGDRGQCRL